MVKKVVIASIAAALAAPSAAFTAPSSSITSSTALSMSANNYDNSVNYGKVAGSAAAAGVLLLSNIFTADAALAADASQSQPDFVGATSTLISARSGGRGGGRASSSARMARPPSSSSRSVNTNTVTRTTVIAPPPVVVSPFGMGYGYNPLGGGFGLGYGLGAVNSIGNEIRDSRQESEIQRERAELDVAKQRQAELEARLAQLERNQVQQPLAPVQR